jgi:hypothetical protein
VVEVDSRNTGRWRRCATIVEAELPEHWATRSYVGLLAVNGAQSNNNDVLSLKTFSSPDAAWQLEHYEGEDDGDGEWSLLVHHIEVLLLASSVFPLVWRVSRMVTISSSARW